MTMTAERTALTRRALRFAQFTVAYNVAEGIASVLLGVLAGLVSVIGFGVDSGIESLSAILVGLRLSARLRQRGANGADSSAETAEANEAAEKRTLRFVALTFFALAAYVVVAGIRDLLLGATPETSPGSIVVLALSIIVMPLLAAAKTRVGRRLGDPLILADAAETRVCVLLSVSTLLGLVVYGVWGWAWVDPVAGFVIALFAIHEGLEAWQGELIEGGDDD